MVLHTTTTAACLLLLAGCVRWQGVPSGTPTEFPRLVRVTTRDSAQYLLEDAKVVAADTVVGRMEGDRLVRIPPADIAHLEARVPSVSGSLGVALIVLVGIGAALALIGHASTL